MESNEQDAVPKAQDATCEQHGPFQQTVLAINDLLKRPILSRCPECKRLEQEEMAASYRRQEAFKRNLRLTEKLGSAAVPPRFTGKRLDGYSTDLPGQAVALEKCRAYLESFEDNRKAGRCLILIGSPGTGKTHLAAAIANHLNHETGYTAVYRTVGGIMQAIKETYNSDGYETEGKIISGLVEADLLVLDEIGASKANPSDFELSTLFAIINGRYEKMNPTVIISNIQADELPAAMGERCIDRMREGGPVVVKFKWESARRSILE